MATPLANVDRACLFPDGTLFVDEHQVAGAADVVLPGGIVADSLMAHASQPAVVHVKPADDERTLFDAEVEVTVYSERGDTRVASGRPVEPPTGIDGAFLLLQDKDTVHAVARDRIVRMSGPGAARLPRIESAGLPAGTHLSYRVRLAECSMVAKWDGGQLWRQLRLRLQSGGADLGLDAALEYCERLSDRRRTPPRRHTPSYRRAAVFAQDDDNTRMYASAPQPSGESNGPEVDSATLDDFAPEYRLFVSQTVLVGDDPCLVTLPPLPLQEREHWVASVPIDGRVEPTRRLSGMLPADTFAFSAEITRDDEPGVSAWLDAWRTPGCVEVDFDGRGRVVAYLWRHSVSDRFTTWRCEVYNRTSAPTAVDLRFPALAKEKLADGGEIALFRPDKAAKMSVLHALAREFRLDKPSGWTRVAAQNDKLGEYRGDELPSGVPSAPQWTTQVPAGSAYLGFFTSHTA